MIAVYDALNSLEAHALKIYLIGNGINAKVGGDYLQGAMGDLPALGIVRVFVEDRDSIRAEQLIQKYQEQDTDDDSWIPSELR